MEQKAVSCSLEKQLKESSARVVTLSRDLSTTQESHRSAVQVLCNCEPLEWGMVFAVFNTIFKTELTL